jgi:hypothetical protein
MKKSTLGQTTAAIFLAQILTFNVACPPVEGDQDASISDASQADITSTGSIVGTIRDELSQGIGEASIRVGDLSVASDWQGAYTLDGIAPGNSNVVVSAPWFADASATVAVIAGQQSQHDVALSAKTLQVTNEDRALADSFNTDFDWRDSQVSIVVVAHATRALLDRAFYYLNPAYYDDGVLSETALTPASPLSIDAQATGFDFAMPTGAPNAGAQVFDNATIVDDLASTPLTTAEIAAASIWEPAVKIHLVNWDLVAAQGLYYASLAIEGQYWGATTAPSFSPQTLQRLFLHNGELWVELAFEPFVQLGTGISDNDGDGRSEVFARIASAHVTTEIFAELTSYQTSSFTALEMKGELEHVLADLYTRSNPVLLKTIGESYDVANLGSFVYPYAVVQHSNQVVNVLLVEP